jgi:ABC-2 type transport system permease protein
MNAGAVSAIMGKDLRAFTRDRFFMLVTVLGLVVYVVIFWLLPDTVDETFTIGVGGDPAMVSALEAGSSGDAGLVATPYADREALDEAVEAGEDAVAGLWFPAGFAQAVASGETPTVTVVIGPDLPAELQPALRALVRELAFAATGAPLPVRSLPEEEAVVGVDRVGNQVSLQEQMRPMLAFLVLLVEAIALATLVAGELQARTVDAITVTPASVTDFLTAKTLFGTALAFTEAVLLLVAIRSFGQRPAMLLAAVALGAVLVTGFALLAGSLGRDFVGVMFISVAFMVPLLVPSFAVLFPGSAAGWVRAMPSYPLVDVIVRATAEEPTWGDVAPSFALLAGWCVVVVLIGWLTLRRRIERAA